MKLKVRVEIELAASLDLYLNVSGVIITALARWGGRMCRQQTGITFVGGRK